MTPSRRYLGDIQQRQHRPVRIHTSSNDHLIRSHGPLFWLIDFWHRLRISYLLFSTRRKENSKAHNTTGSNPNYNWGLQAIYLRNLFNPGKQIFDLFASASPLRRLLFCFKYERRRCFACLRRGNSFTECQPSKTTLAHSSSETSNCNSLVPAGLRAAHEPVYLSIHQSSR